MFKGDLEVDLEGDSKGDFRGDYKQDIERDLLSSSGQLQTGMEKPLVISL